MKQLPGLAKARYAGISSHSSSPVYTRFNKALAASQTSSVVSKASTGSQSGPPRSGGGGVCGGNLRARDPEKPKDMSIITCYGCYKKGHFKSHCPVLKAATSGDKA